MKDIISGLFVAVLLISNLLSSAKLIDIGGVVFDAGTLVFPIAYIFGDILTEVYGYQQSRRVIWTGFLSTALLGLFTWFTGILPGEQNWQGYAGDSAYTAILGGVSGLVVASLLGYFCGEFTNSYVLARMKVLTKGRWLPVRTITSTLVGQGLDTVVFFLAATALGVFPVELLWPLISFNYVFKVAIEVLFTPITVRVVTAVKRAENMDHYDRDTDFNPFHLR